MESAQEHLGNNRMIIVFISNITKTSFLRDSAEDMTARFYRSKK